MQLTASAGMSDVASKESPLGTMRTREHIISSQSHNYVEKFFIDQGHTVDRPTDYGIDLLVNTFDEDGYPEAGDIRLQLKASDQFKYSKDGESILLQIEVKHYHYWMKRVMPVFLVLYDAKNARAHWLYVQAYFASNETITPAGKKVTY